MDNTIRGEEKLFRNVITNPSFWKKETGKPSSALFKDSKGVSVDRDGDRNHPTIITTFKERFGDENIKAIVYLNASYCIDQGTHLVYCPEPNNIFHSEIHQSPERIQLSSGQAKRLVNECVVVYEN